MTMRAGRFHRAALSLKVEPFHHQQSKGAAYLIPGATHADHGHHPAVLMLENMAVVDEIAGKEERDLYEHGVRITETFAPLRNCVAAAFSFRSQIGRAHV